MLYWSECTSRAKVSRGWQSVALATSSLIPQDFPSVGPAPRTPKTTPEQRTVSALLSLSLALSCPVIPLLSTSLSLSLSLSLSVSLSLSSPGRSIGVKRTPGFSSCPRIRWIPLDVDGGLYRSTWAYAKDPFSSRAHVESLLPGSSTHTSSFALAEIISSICRY